MGGGKVISNNGAVGWRSIKAAPTLGSKPEPIPSVFVVFKPSETEGPVF